MKGSVSTSRSCRRREEQRDRYWRLKIDQIPEYREKDTLLLLTVMRCSECVQDHVLGGSDPLLPAVSS